MKSLLSLFLLSTILSLGAAELPQHKLDKIADAIYIVEGRTNAKIPYGILSVRVKGEVEARRVCINTIRNNYTRWEASGKTNNYIEFLGSRYAPVKAHPLNRNWVPNMTRILGTNYIQSL